MADTSGMNDLRGIDIDKLATGFAEEELVLKSFCEVSSTSAREIRWYKKTAGFLDSTDTSGITGSLIANVAYGALPYVVEQSWTRQTSYVKKFFVESPWMAFEDIRDSDPDVLGDNIRDLTRSVLKQVDIRIYNVGTESGVPVDIGTSAAVGTGWDDTSNGNPILDILSGSRFIRTNGYDINRLVLYINPFEYKALLNYIITVKGSSIPAFSSSLAQNGVLMRILTADIVVSENATTDQAWLFVPNKAVKWKSFAPITAQTKEEVGIGIKIRCWEEGEALLTNPKASYLITDTLT